MNSAMAKKQVKSPVKVRFNRGGIGLIESHHSEEFFMDWRRDRFPKILFIIDGSGFLHHGKDSMAFRAPAVCVVPAAVLHRFEDQPGHPVSLYGLCLKPPSLAVRRLAAAVFRTPAVHNPMPTRLAGLLRELLVEERRQAPFGALLQTSLVRQVLVELVRLPAPPNQTAPPDSRLRVGLCAREMRDGFWREQDVDSAARKAGLSRRRFTQLFRESEGESWHSRLTRLRLHHAAVVLRTTKLPVRAVAFESGYADLSHFYRAFRAMHGAPPAAFRNSGAKIPNFTQGPHVVARP